MNEILKVDDASIVPVREMVDNLSNLILSGRVLPAIAGVGIRRLEKALEEVKKNPQVKEAIRLDTERYITNGKSGNCFGAVVTSCATYTTYDFNASQDPRWNAWNELERLCKERKGLYEEELKLLLKEDEAKKAKIKIGTLGIITTTKEIMPTSIPVINYDNQGDLVGIILTQQDEISVVYPPTKIQTMGIKYSNL